eukprot:g16810.t1
MGKRNFQEMERSKQNHITKKEKRQQQADLISMVLTVAASPVVLTHFPKHLQMQAWRRFRVVRDFVLRPADTGFEPDQ